MSDKAATAPVAADQPALAVEGLSLEFRTREGTVRALERVGLRLHRGEFVGVVGESGSGKSTTARAILGLVGATRGQIAVKSGRTGRPVQMVFQDPYASLNPRLKVGAIIGRKRAFAIGCVVYGAGSFTTAIAPNLPVLLFGWSFLEGVGAALILPAIVALVAGNFARERRPAAYGLVAAAGAVAVAVGPLIGGFCTTYFSWRWVFAGEVVVVLLILLLTRRVGDAPVEDRPQLDIVGAVLSALGLGLIVFSVLRTSEWGWIQPKPEGPSWAGLPPSVWLGLAGLFVIWVFFRWQERRESEGKEPLVRIEMLRNRQLSGGVTMFFFQYLVQAGFFFVVLTASRLFFSASIRLTTRGGASTAGAMISSPAIFASMMRCKPWRYSSL